MNKLGIKIFATILMSMVGGKAFAYDIAVENTDGVTICYNYINNSTELEVTIPDYHYWGKVNIPERVTYMNRTRSVTSIGDGAFWSCSGLTSVTIPNSVTSIGDYAFHYCSGLTSVTIPNSVTSIGDYAFHYCSGLTSVAIGNSVTSIGDEAFSYCSGLTSVAIGNSVTSIGDKAFSYCGCLTSVTIPNSVTSIGSFAFTGCSGLTTVHISDIVAWCGIDFKSDMANPLYFAHHIYMNGEEIKDLVIPNSVTSIGDFAFTDCRGLTSVIIPNSVTSIGYRAFRSCSGLTSVTIGSSVTSIGDYAFEGCDIPTVVSLIENPFAISKYVFSNNTRKNATLYVPVGTIDKYKATDGWKDFLFIEEGTGGAPTTQQTCEKPTIADKNGKLTFNCETEGAICKSTITDSDITSYSSNEVQLGVTYNISVYATKGGYENSDVTTATLCWIDVEPKTEGLENSIAQVRANPVLIQTGDGWITVNGADDGTVIGVYSTNGVLSGTEISRSGSAVVSTNLQAGSVAIVKIGNKSVKVTIR